MNASTESTTQSGQEIIDVLTPGQVQESVPLSATASELANWFALNGVDIADDETDDIRNFEVLEGDKPREFLKGRQILLVSWQFNLSKDRFDKETGDALEFVSALIQFVNADGEPQFGVINDGGTGIYRQLLKLTKTRMEKKHKSPQAGRLARRGLRRSDYLTPEGEKATTWYLDF